MAILHKKEDHLLKTCEEYEEQAFYKWFFVVLCIVYEIILIYATTQLYGSFSDDFEDHPILTLLTYIPLTILRPFLTMAEGITNILPSSLFGVIIALILCALVILALTWPLIIGYPFLCQALTLQDDIERLRSGIEGEERALSILSAGLPDSYHIFQNLYIRYEGKSSETDLVVVGPQNLFIIEVKNYVGTISGNFSDQQLTRTKENGYQSSIYNPARQVGTHVYRLSNFLREKGYKVWVQGLVMFTNKECVLKLDGKSDIPMLFGSDLFCRHILDFQPLYPYTASIQEQIIELLDKN